MRTYLQEQMARVPLTQQNESLTARKEGLSAGHSQELKEQEELNRLNEELTRIKAQHLDAVEKIAVEEQAEIARLTQAKAINASTLAVVRMISEAKLIDAYNQNLDKYNEALLKSAEFWGRIRKEQNTAGEEGLKKFFEPSLVGLERMKTAMDKLNQEYIKYVGDASKQGVAQQISMVGFTGKRSDPMGTLQKQQAIERAAIEKTYNAQLEEANRTLISGELILKRRNLATERQLELDRLDNELAQRRAADTGTIRGNLGAGARGAKSPTEIANDTINSSIDRLSDQLSRLVTGQKTDFKKMVVGIGQEVAKESIKSGLQQALGHFGLGGKRKPTLAAGDPGHVIVDNMPMGPGSSTPAGGSSGGGSIIDAITGGILGTGIHVSPEGRASGGDVSASDAYVVGEHGPELLMGASGRIASNSESVRTLGGGGTHFTIENIDCRGTDPVLTEQRFRTALVAIHGSAVNTSIRANRDITRRTPAHS